MKLFRRVTGWASALLISLALLGAPGPDSGTWACFAQSTPTQWDQPAAALADQIASFVGPGQATVSITNLSSIPNAAMPAIRSLLEKDLKAHGITIANADSANNVRITLSQNDRERLWVAEIVQGNETRVVMVTAESGSTLTKAVADYLTLRRETLPLLLDSRSGILPENPILGALEHGSTFLILRSYGIEEYALGEGGYQQQRRRASVDDRRQFSRDPRGFLNPTADQNGATAFLGQWECLWTYTPAPATPEKSWNTCHPSDEPWPILQNNDPGHPITIKAFYNSARNYFTGVITPSLGIDLPPFYSAALLQRANGTALLIGGIDGKIQLVDNGALKPLTGARDWGSDFAVLKSGCGSGEQVIASGSGEALNDSVRAYELPAQEAIPASAPLAMNGAVTALWPAPDGKSLLASVRLASGDYEVVRVTALCN